MSRVALVIGPDQHGVVRHARELARAGGLPVVTEVSAVPDGATVLLDVTDRLFGATALDSGETLTELAAELGRRGCPLVVTLHDVPPPGDDPVQHRRSVVYRTVARAAVGVIVASEHERDRLRTLAPELERVAVVPLPVLDRVAAPPAVGSRVGPPASVTVLGFVYPGKGYAEVLAAMDMLPPQIPLIVLGRAADGHDDLAAALTAGARPVQITGFVPDDAISVWLHAATIAVAPHRAVSASSSIATWWAHGRRPLVPAGPYAGELQTRNPGALWVYGDDLGAALHQAWAHPDATWLPPGQVLHPRLAAVVAARAQAVTRWTS